MMRQPRTMVHHFPHAQSAIRSRARCGLDQAMASLDEPGMPFVRREGSSGEGDGPLEAAEAPSKPAWLLPGVGSIDEAALARSSPPGRVAETCFPT